MTRETQNMIFDIAEDERLEKQWYTRALVKSSLGRTGSVKVAYARNYRAEELSMMDCHTFANEIHTLITRYTIVVIVFPDGSLGPPSHTRLISVPISPTRLFHVSFLLKVWDRSW